MITRGCGHAELQMRAARAQCLNDYSSGIESALNCLLKAIETGTVPSDPVVLEVALKRAIASGARLHRSRSLALKKWVLPPESISTSAAAVANIELGRIGRTIKHPDEEILIDAAFGNTDREIAGRHASTPGAIRVRLSRLRLKLAANGHSEARPSGCHRTRDPISGVRGPEPRTAIQAA